MYLLIKTYFKATGKYTRKESNRLRTDLPLNWRSHLTTANHAVLQGTWGIISWNDLQKLLLNSWNHYKLAFQIVLPKTTWWPTWKAWAWAYPAIQITTTTTWTTTTGTWSIKISLIELRQGSSWAWSRSLNLCVSCYCYLFTLTYRRNCRVFNFF